MQTYNAIQPHYAKLIRKGIDMRGYKGVQHSESYLLRLNLDFLVSSLQKVSYPFTLSFFIGNTRIIIILWVNIQDIF